MAEMSSDNTKGREAPFFSQINPRLSVGRQPSLITVLKGGN